MTGFIKMPNCIFDYKLTAKALFVYSYMLLKVSRLQTVSACYSDISVACNLSVSSVQNAVKELSGHKLITKQNRYNERGYIANRYYISNLIKGEEKWFPVEREVFTTKIAPTDFMVYCFICRAMGAKSGEAFPSLTAICEGTGLSRGRAAQATAFLRAFTFINKVHRRYKRTRAYRHNRYLSFSCNLKKGSGKAHTLRMRASVKKIVQNQFETIVTRCLQKIKSFLNKSGVNPRKLEVVRFLPNRS